MEEKQTFLYPQNFSVWSNNHIDMRQIRENNQTNIWEHDIPERVTDPTGRLEIGKEPEVYQTFRAKT